MIINTSVSVASYFDSNKKLTVPKKILWNGRLYPVTKVGLHYSQYEGRKLVHIFSVTSFYTFLKLIFDTETLSWTLSEARDANEV